VQEAITQGYLENGADIAVSTTLPFGAGISSSAAVTVGVLKLTRDLSGANITDTQIAIQARHVENEFIGMPCGIMDQMAVAIAHEGQALALDTDSLRYSLIDLPTDYHMAVVHSGQFRQLNEGRYKERKEECDKIKAFLGTDDICQISDSALQSLSSLSDRLQKRAKHCATEHRRTISAIEAIKSNEIAKLGQLMSQSHSSMRDDFDITLPKVDALVEDAVKFGALGARQTGGGFGGCIVACVPKKNVTKWSEKLLSYHSEAFWVC